MGVVGRPKSRWNGLEDPFYAKMAVARGMSVEKVLARSRRRARAVAKLSLRLSRDIHQLRLDNPFMESHAWKYLVRESLRMSWNRQNKNRPS